MSERKNWTEEELTLALALYVQTPFGKTHTGNPVIQKFATAIGRSPGSVVFKLGNLARLDSKLQSRGVVGLKNGSKLDKVVWDRFIGKDTAETDLAPLFDAASSAAQQLSLKTEDYLVVPSVLSPSEKLPPIETLETERVASVRVRRNQNLFRATVLSAYDNCCAITGLRVPQLLEAAHIIPWSESTKNRLQPSNGIALSVAMHRAFDANLIGITPDFVCRVSPKFTDAVPVDTPARIFLENIDCYHLREPVRFQANRDFLAERYEQFLQASEL